MSADIGLWVIINAFICTSLLNYLVSECIILTNLYHLKLPNPPDSFMFYTSQCFHYFNRNIFIEYIKVHISNLYLLLYSLHNGLVLLHKYTSMRASDGVPQSVWHNHVWYHLCSGQIVTGLSASYQITTV